MNVVEKIAALVKLGEYVEEMTEQDHHDLILQASNENPWFISSFIKSALSGISKILRKDLLEKWMDRYSEGKHHNYDIGLILAGNIPLVGFHDILCVLLSDHIAHVKTSHQDHILVTGLIDKLLDIEPRFLDNIRIVDKLYEVNAVIATGSDNSARYFLSYYRNIPHLIRKNRTSIAILDGSESKRDLIGLADDSFLYFGLGCRNVSKIYLTENSVPESLIQAYQDKKWIGNHEKYHHNYIYQKSLLQMTNNEFYDGGFFLLERSEKLVSPVSVVYYSYYTDLNNLQDSLFWQNEKIQSIVTANPGIKNNVPFGKAQYPDPWDYADQVDTLEFLLQL
jgi:hypothetical protein